MAVCKKSSNWLSPKAVTRCSHIEGYGTFAKTRIAKGELIIAFGGSVVTLSEWRKLPKAIKKRSLAIHDDLELCPRKMDKIGDGDYVNHSCEPNAGLRGQIFLVAMRDIMQDEEITFDYTMVISDPKFRIDCKCGHDSCRKIITGDDWKNPLLQNKYDGYFSVYIKEKIDSLRKLLQCC
jgi:SET domain-containing protein